MNLKAFKISQKSIRWKEFQIFFTKMSVFDLRNYVYVKRIKDDYKQLSDDNFWIRIFEDISWIEWEDVSNMRLGEVQRQLKDSKIKWVKEYIREDLGVFPSSILLGTKKWDTFINFKEESHDIYNLEFLNLNKREWFFIIDGQHRIYWILNYLVDKIKKDFQKFDFTAYKWKTISEEISFLFNVIWEENAANFKLENEFELPIVIMNEISVNLMVELFADINTSATKLENDFSTYIYWVATNKDLEKKIFVTIWEKLNNNIKSPLYDRIKLPYDLYDSEGRLLKEVRWNYSKISINPFYTNSKSLLALWKKKINYFQRPFNLLIEEFIKDSEYSEYNSLETISFLINSLIILYFWTYSKIQEVYGIERYKNEDFKFISSSNHFMYLEIIRIVLVKLFLDTKNLVSLFSTPEIINKISDIFDKEIKESLKKVYSDYQYFEEWSLKWTWGITGQNIKNQFKIHYYWVEIEKWKLIWDLSKEQQNKLKDDIKKKEKTFSNLLY